MGMSDKEKNEWFEAAKNNRLDEITKLAGRFPKEIDQYQNGWSALMIAALNGHSSIVQFLLERGSNVNGAPDDGWTALMLAAQEGHLLTVLVLLGKNAEVDRTNAENATALMIAAGRGFLPVVNTLLGYKADPNTVGKGGWTALKLAEHYEHPDVIKALADAIKVHFHCSEGPPNKKINVNT